MTSRLSRIARDERGNAFVEMGLILPVFATLLVGATDMARGYSAKLHLEQAAQRSIEYVQVRDFVETDVTEIKNNAAAAASVSASAVTVDYWLECNASRQGNYNGTCEQNATMARFLSVEVKKPFKPMFGTKFFPGASANGTIEVKAKAGVRTQ